MHAIRYLKRGDVLFVRSRTMGEVGDDLFVSYGKGSVFPSVPLQAFFSCRSIVILFKSNFLRKV